VCRSSKEIVRQIYPSDFVEIYQAGLIWKFFLAPQSILVHQQEHPVSRLLNNQNLDIIKIIIAIRNERLW
jgi:hypothetical protein